MDHPHFGGQAVIEGVMMRGPGRVAIAVRRTDEQIVLSNEPFHSASERWPVLKLPILRGVLSLFESLVLGINALVFSANQLAEGEGEEISPTQMALTVAFSFIVAIGLFVLLPTLLANMLRVSLPKSVWLNLAEGLARLAILLAYIVLVSRMKDIQRVLEYHGAEHKAINALEQGEDLTVSSVRKYSILHPRCGTSFLFFVALVTIFLYSFFGWPGVLQRIIIRLSLLPVVAGVAYEAIKISDRNRTSFLGVFTLPGLWLQRLTAREPDDSQIEVALHALKAVLDTPGNST